MATGDVTLTEVIVSRCGQISNAERLKEERQTADKTLA